VLKTFVIMEKIS